MQKNYSFQKALRIRRLVFIFLAITLTSNSVLLNATPFPVKGEIFDGNDQPFGTANVYPRYVEIFDAQNSMVGKVGILVEEGIAKLFLVGDDENYSLVGYASGGKIFDSKDSVVGSYFWTPTWSFVHDKKGKRAGKVKCIAWPRVCAVGVGGYLLNLFKVKK